MLDNLRNTEYYTSTNYGIQQTNECSIKIKYHMVQEMSRL